MAETGATRKAKAEEAVEKIVDRGTWHRKVVLIDRLQRTGLSLPLNNSQALVIV